MIPSLLHFTPAIASALAKALQSRHDLSGTGPQVAAAIVRYPRGTGSRGARADACARHPAPASRLAVHRHARRRQDHAVAHPGQIAQLRNRHHLQALRRLSRLHRDRCRPVRRLPRTGRGLEPRRRGNDPAAGAGRLRAGRGPLQGLHDRRSAHAHGARVQRDAQDAGRAAAARQIHPRHDRSAEDPGHGAVALPAIQSEADAGRLHRGPPAGGAGRGTGRLRSAGPAPDRPGRVGLDARRAVADRPGHRLQRRQPDRGRRARHARHHRPASPGAPAGRLVHRRRQGRAGGGRRTRHARPVVRRRAGRPGGAAVARRHRAARVRRDAGRGSAGGRHRPPGAIAASRRGAAVLFGGGAQPRRTDAGAGRVRRLHHGLPAHAGAER
ncbi:hypothetical protein LMG26846_01574 [Achromobacter insuavis]|nr:hypothetical protein LMG26846_01574 [Achromobacter insuavis]